MIIEIGIVAGEIWQLLDKYGTMRIGEIISKLSKSEYIVLMSLGWLGREGHIVIDRKEGDLYKDYKITLRK
ncbi:MAG: winged helix-turn-helix domain-containing protein [Candidatus Omnitrophica bacterium]|nr:winged helix-turn-helix domain-containing protein [Candidatus Omnitrophota bacterium]